MNPGVAFDRRTCLRSGGMLLTAALLLVACHSAPAESPPEITALPAASPAAASAGEGRVTAPAATAEATAVQVAPAEIPSTIPPMAPAPPALLTENAAFSAALEGRIDALAETMSFSGVVLAARDGVTLFSKGYGDADRERQTLNTAQTRFRIGSLTKQFTAEAVLMLQDRGLLDVQDPICDYLDACPEAWQAVTIHHLLTHTSGIPDFTHFADYERTKGQPSTPEQTIDRFREAELDFEPGSKWSYSNSGYVLLGRIIEKTSGQRYEDFLQANVFDPLGMADSGYDHNRDDLAVGYAGGREASAIDMSIPYAAGGLYSTAEDLLRWDRGLDTGLLLPAELQAEMFTSRAAIPDSGGMGYGYGWETGEAFGQSVVSHMGGIEGFSAGITRLLGDHTLVVVLSNEQQTNPRAVSRAVMQALYAE